jgi:hypothetical protein
MFIGQTLTAENVNTDGSTVVSDESIVYSPWFPRGGNAGTIATEILVISRAATDGSSSSTPKLEMTVQTKNTDQADSAATDKGSAESASTGAMKVEPSVATGLLELVRIKFRLYDSESINPFLPRTFYVVFRALNPSWETN